MAWLFGSGFVIETDARFNINELEMPLSDWIGITFTIFTFLFAYCFITSESTSAFAFINKSLKNLFFFDDCQGLLVILGDFFVGLSQAMLKTIQKTRLRAEITIG